MLIGWTTIASPSNQEAFRTLHGELVSNRLQNQFQMFTGWWFGCYQFYFPINIGLLSSSQLTNSYFSGRGGPGPPTRHCFCLASQRLDLSESPSSLGVRPLYSVNHDSTNRRILLGEGFCNCNRFKFTE